jgi:hypothetical protein
MTSRLTNELLAAGRVLREPPGRGAGYWAGAPGAFFDATEQAWYLTYRLRRPRGVAPDRGGEVRIARSTDLVRWDDVVAITKDRYDSASIERSCLHRGPDGLWRYFTSYVHPADGRWCTAVLRAPRVADLDPARREVIFTGPPRGLEGVKDPWISSTTACTTSSSASPRPRRRRPTVRTRRSTSSTPANASPPPRSRSRATSSSGSGAAWCWPRRRRAGSATAGG